MCKKVDFLVIGSGIAGFSYSLKVAEYGKVCLVTKANASENNTNYAQGGIAAVLYEPDSFEKHIKDTIKAGSELCNENIVRIVITEATERIKELIEWGTNFDKSPSGRYDLHMEGGHSEYRVLHHKDSTGHEIMRALLEKAKQHPNIEILEDHFAIEILTQHHLGVEVNKSTNDICCYGAYILNSTNNKVIKILSKRTLLATGGAGAVYSNTTNPKVATGDGIAMVYRAKGIVENMEFFQFHPTALYDKNEAPLFLISEAVRGFGGILKNRDGEEFMHKYDERGCLAPRDIVARAIDHELKTRGDDFVLLDCTHLNSSKLKSNFPNIYIKCLEKGYDMSKDPIPVVPAAHYLCGGIKVNEFGKTSINNLYAAGECASTGLHGANRLASNSLLEALVFSHRAYLDSIKNIDKSDFCYKIPEWDDSGTVYTEEMVLITQNLREVQEIMSNYVGIVRSNLRLDRALKRLEIIYVETEDLFKRSKISEEICELRNIINIAYLIIKMAVNRKESIGLHYNIDYNSLK